MPRKLRIESPGAIYHVMSRGDRREDIVLNDVDRQDFVKTLAEACPKAQFQVHAYCLMRNPRLLEDGLRLCTFESGAGENVERPGSSAGLSVEQLGVVFERAGTSSVMDAGGTVVGGARAARGYAGSAGGAGTAIGGEVTEGDAATVKGDRSAVADGDLEECSGTGLQVAAACGRHLGRNRCLHALV